MPVNHDLSPTYVPATPEYVLAVFRDELRQNCSIEYDTGPQLELTFETTRRGESPGTGQRIAAAISAAPIAKVLSGGT